MHGEAGDGDKGEDAESTVAIKVGGCTLTAEETELEIYQRKCYIRDGVG